MMYGISPAVLEEWYQKNKALADSIRVHMLIRSNADWDVYRARMDAGDTIDEALAAVSKNQNAVHDTIEMMK